MSNPFDNAGYAGANQRNAQGAYPVSTPGYQQGGVQLPGQQQFPGLPQFSEMQGGSGIDGFMSAGNMPFQTGGGGGDLMNMPVSGSVLQTFSDISSSMSFVMTQLMDVTKILGSAVGQQGAAQQGAGATGLDPNAQGAQGTQGQQDPDAPQVELDLDQELGAQGFSALTNTDVDYEVPARPGEEPEEDSVTVMEAIDLDENGTVDKDEFKTFKGVIQDGNAPADLDPEKKAQLEAAGDAFKDEMGSRSKAMKFIDGVTDRKAFDVFSAAADTDVGVSEDDANALAQGLQSADASTVGSQILQERGVEKPRDLKDELDEVEPPEADEDEAGGVEGYKSALTEIRNQVAGQAGGDDKMVNFKEYRDVVNNLQVDGKPVSDEMKQRLISNFGTITNKEAGNHDVLTEGDLNGILGDLENPEANVDEILRVGAGKNEVHAENRPYMEALSETVARADATGQNGGVISVDEYKQLVNMSDVPQDVKDRLTSDRGVSAIQAAQEGPSDEINRPQLQATIEKLYAGDPQANNIFPA